MCLLYVFVEKGACVPSFHVSVLRYATHCDVSGLERRAWVVKLELEPEQFVPYHDTIYGMSGVTRIEKSANNNTFVLDVIENQADDVITDIQKLIPKAKIKLEK